MKRDSINGATRFAVKHREACERIADMLGRNLGGEAFFEAEKFLKAEAPDLYDKIGLAKIEEAKSLKKQVASLDDRVSKLENEDADGLAYQRQNAPLRPSRNFIGKETE